MMKQARETVFSQTPKSGKNQNDYGGGIIQFFIENGGTCCKFMHSGLKSIKHEG
jgi:hypothetical protein